MKIFKIASIAAILSFMAAPASALKYNLDDDVYVTGDCNSGSGEYQCYGHAAVIPYEEAYGNGGASIAFKSELQNWVGSGGDQRSIEVFMYVKASDGNVYAKHAQCGHNEPGATWGSSNRCAILDHNNFGVIGWQHETVPENWCQMPCDSSTPVMTGAPDLKVYDKYCAVSIRLAGGSDLQVVDPYVRSNNKVKQGYVAAPDAHYLWENVSVIPKSGVKDKAMQVCGL